jgi:hypothetical protein
MFRIGFRNCPPLGGWQLKYVIKLAAAVDLLRMTNRDGAGDQN